MSMPPPLTVAVISEHNPRGAEIAIAASRALSMSYLSVQPVSSYRECRDKLLKVCQVFSPLDKVIVSPEAFPLDYANFWLAMDVKGEQVVQKLFKQADKPWEKGDYHFPAKLAHCGFPVPDVPDNNNFGLWLEYLEIEMDDWKKLIKRIQSDWS